MTLTTLTLTDARHMLLAAQGLAYPPVQPVAKADVLTAIRHMGVLQIDTIHVVARSPYLVLWSRLGDYTPAWLDELEAEGRLFEYWAHAACFIPIEDYPLYVSRMGEYIQHYYKKEWVDQRQETINLVLARIRADGPVRSADFERTDGQKGGWWNWKEEKRVLEYLHTVGELMIVRREKFQRIYDLRERILPGWNAAPTISLEEAQDELAVRAVRHLGAAPARWVPDYYRMPKLGIAARMARLAAAGRLLTVQLEDHAEAWYVHPENCTLLEAVQQRVIAPTYTTLLSPFDPLVWDRERARVLFGFDYNIECYLPQEKRRYGYFSLPILHAGQLVGRLDAKAHRQDGLFEVRALHWEAHALIQPEIWSAVSAAIQRCADWHGTPRVEIRASLPNAAV